MTAPTRARTRVQHSTPSPHTPTPSLHTLTPHPHPTHPLLTPHPCSIPLPFPATEEAAALHGATARQLKRELRERGIATSGLTEKDDCRAALRTARAEQAVTDAGFGADLLRFVRALLQPTAPQVWAQWAELLGRFVLRPPPGTPLILSGRHSMERQAKGMAAGVRLKEAELYGQLALHRHCATDHCAIAAAPPLHHRPDRPGRRRRRRRRQRKKKRQKKRCKTRLCCDNTFVFLFF